MRFYINLRLKRHQKAGTNRWMAGVTSCKEAAAPAGGAIDICPTACGGCVEGWIAPSGEPFDVCPTACRSVGG